MNPVKVLPIAATGEIDDLVDLRPHVLGCNIWRFSLAIERAGGTKSDQFKQPEKDTLRHFVDAFVNRRRRRRTRTEPASHRPAASRPSLLQPHGARQRCLRPPPPTSPRPTSRVPSPARPSSSRRTSGSPRPRTSSPRYPPSSCPTCTASRARSWTGGRRGGGGRRVTTGA
ncbi:hypothetical protein THAOC_14794 [Thalassiosira oceanica]|uniref:Uncharacterized protein n=1 Tax=Thalassiosira oceanica TaxID=159749 RepID=K0SEA3_THAOC|nr:hypothetical protein THAOC_14794 [Thalassiosira oceanica]|eukprot:EJK64468.1 hypothetical protein THAOC_14794 [Thalassiosira oceanica]